MTEGFSAWIAKDSPASASMPSRPSRAAKRLLTSTASISGITGSCQVAGDLRPGDVARHRLFDMAAVRRLRTARVEGATRRQIAQQRRQTGYAGKRAALLERGQRSDQRARVGVVRVCDDLADRRHLD